MTRWFTAGAALLTATLALSACSGHHRRAASGQRPHPEAAVLNRASAAMASTSYTFTMSGSEVGTPKPTSIRAQGRVSEHRPIGTFATGESALAARVAGPNRFVQLPGQSWRREPGLARQPPAWDTIFSRPPAVNTERGEGGTFVVTGRLDGAGLAALGFSTGQWATGSLTLRLDAAYHVTSMVTRGVGHSPTAKLTETIDLSGFGTAPAVPAQPPSPVTHP